jgi:hypothetical protein
VTRGITDVALIGFEPHGFGQPQRHGAFLGVAQGQFAVRRVESDFKIQQPLGIGPGVNTQGAFIRANHRAVGGHPPIARAQHPDRPPGFHLGKTVVNNAAEIPVFGPKIMAVHVAVGEPQRPVMFVVMILPGHIAHGPVPRHAHPARAQHRITKRPGNIVEDILREKLAVDLNAHPVVQRGKPHTLPGGGDKSLQPVTTPATPPSKASQSADRRPLRLPVAWVIVFMGILVRACGFVSIDQLFDGFASDNDTLPPVN